MLSAGFLSNGKSGVPEVFKCVRSGCLVDPKIVHLVFEILEVCFKVETEGRLQDF
jgi:hypothetical protein